MNCFHLANASGASCIEFLAGIFSRHNQTGQKWLGWILNKQIKTQTSEQTKKQSKQNKTKQKQNKTKQKTSKLNKEWLLKKKKKKKNHQPKRRMAIEWKFNVLSQESVKKRNFSRNYLSVPATLLCDFLGKDGIASVFLHKFLSPVIKGIYTR